MRGWGQPPLVMIRPGEEALDEALAQRGYAVRDPVVLLAGDAAAMAPPEPDPQVIFGPAPLAIMTDIWRRGGIGPGRLAVMARAAGPRAFLLGRAGDRPAGAAFVAAAGDVAMIHALEVAPFARRQWRRRRDDPRRPRLGARRGGDSAPRSRRHLRQRAGAGALRAASAWRRPPATTTGRCRADRLGDSAARPAQLRPHRRAAWPRARGPTSRGIASAGPFVAARERGDEGGCGSPVRLQIRVWPPRGRDMRPPSGGGRIRISSTAEIRSPDRCPRDLRPGDGPGRPQAENAWARTGSRGAGAARSGVRGRVVERERKVNARRRVSLYQ